MYTLATNISVGNTSGEMMINVMDVSSTTGLVNNNFEIHNTSSTAGCLSPGDKPIHISYFGIQLAVPNWEAILTAIVLSIIIILTIIGNVLVILSVFTYKPLRIVQNFFIVSLAVADLTVAVLVLPFNVAYSILGRWEFGIHMCKMWLTCDVMCCTSSILNLCAIALDRYWAITDPINYAQKRTVNRVLLLIAGVWILSLVISSPPLVGWNDWPDEFSSDYPCQLTSNQGYVIYSSLGSFYIPLIIMTIVYIEIYVATRRRLRERARASRINAISLKGTCEKDMPTNLQDQESVSSETNHNEQSTRTNEKSKQKENSSGFSLSLSSSTLSAKKRKEKNRSKIKDSIKHQDKTKNKQKSERLLQPTTRDDSVTDNPDNSSESQTKPNGDGNSIMVDNDEIQSQAFCKSSSSYAMNKKQPGVYQFIEEKQKISLSKERRAARTLGIIMGVFVVCWLPFFLMYVILPFCPSCCPTDKLINFITWLGYINSALNPVIYTIFNLDYRRAFKKLLGIKY